MRRCRPGRGVWWRVSVRGRGRRVVGWVRSRRTPRWQLLSGRAAGQVQPVEVHLVMTDRSLLGTGDPDRSVFEPGRIPGHGSVPAPVARAWLREGLEDPPAAATDVYDPSSVPVQPGAAGSAAAAVVGRVRRGCGCGGCTRARTGGTWSRWTPAAACSGGCCAGCWCCVMTCAPPRGARRRSCTPTTPPPPAREARPRSRRVPASAPAATRARKPPAGATASRS